MRNLTNELLDQLIQSGVAPTDYKLATRLGVRQSTVSNYRSGTSQMSDEVAVRACALLKRSPEAVLVRMTAERAKNADVKKVWLAIEKLISRHSK